MERTVILSDMDMINELKLAVLIDADNIPYSNIKGMMEEIAKYGTPTFKRIYGDWTRPSLSGWKGVLLENAITPIQQYSYTKGKNSTDSALIIDAMDILYTAQVDGFCIISSDSDFTRLATRLREAGKKVFGMGERKTPMSFIASCNKFIYIEILQTDVKAAPARPATSRVSKERVSRNKPVAENVIAEKSTAEKVAAERTTADRVAAGKVAGNKVPAHNSSEDKATADNIPQDRNQAERQAEDKGQANRAHTESQLNDAVIRLIIDSITALAEEDGWVGLAVLGALIIKKQPDFDSRNYGFKKLVELVKSIPQIEIDKRETSRNNVSHFYVRLRENTND